MHVCCTEIESEKLLTLTKYEVCAWDELGYFQPKKKKKNQVLDLKGNNLTLKV